MLIFTEIGLGQGESTLSLSVKDVCKNVKLLQDTSTVGEICILVKYSPKREKMLGDIKENIDARFDEDALEDHYSIPPLDKLCVTRWTVRGKCFEKIILNYEILMQLWDLCLSEPLATEVKARIIGCKKQMSFFSFFFGLYLGQRLFMITDNLSKTLQYEKMSAVSSKNCASLTIKTFQGMTNSDDIKVESLWKNSGFLQFCPKSKTHPFLCKIYRRFHF